MNCSLCGVSFEPTMFTWARNTVLGEEALGYDPNITTYSHWYGRQRWRPCDVEEYQVPTVDVCDECFERRERAYMQASELCSPIPAPWFDPADCGESW